MNWLNKKYVILLVTVLFSIAANAQKDKIPFSGTWKGVITQADGYRAEFGIELNLTQKGKKLMGRSYVFVDSIYAEMNIEGIVHSSSIILIKDLEILDSKLTEGLEWCMKNYQLVLKKEGPIWKLEGHWQGKTTGKDCDPGKVKLKRLVPRA